MPSLDSSVKILAMIASLRHFLGWMVSAFRSREDLVLENLALHQQLLALHAKRPRRRLTALHKLFWVALRTFWSGWTKPLILVTPSPSLRNIARDLRESRIRACFARPRLV